jgi:predicted Zn-dependent peptidase
MYTRRLGDKVLLCVDPKDDRETTKLEMWYSHGGSWFEKPEDRGRQHLLEHCLVARTKQLNDLEFKEYCFEHGISYNAYTSPSVVDLSGKSHKTDFPRMLKLFLELFFDPTFDEAILQKEREIVLREIADRQGDPEYQLWQDIAAKTYAADSIENHEVLGDPEAVRTTTLNDLKRLYATMLQNSYCIISLAGGGLNESELLAAIEPYSTQLTGGYLPLPHKFGNDLICKNIAPLYHQLAHKEAGVSVIIPSPVNWDNRPARSVFAELFLGWNGTGLYDYLRDELGLIYGYNFSFDEPGQALKLDLNGELALVPKILDGIKAYFVSFEEKFLESKFNILKANTAKKYLQARDNLGFDANSLISNLFSYNKMETSDEYVKRIEQVSVQSIRDIFESIHAVWSKSTIIVTSRDESVKALTYELN